MVTDADVLNELYRLMNESSWRLLADRAIGLAADHPDDAQVAAYAAHALRKLGAIEDGYRYAQSAVAIDPLNLYAQNRLSLLANLAGNYEVAYAAGEAIVEREPAHQFDALNLAVTVVNAIHAASK